MTTETASLAGLSLHFETGDIARQAGGACIVRAGDSVLLATAQCDRRPSLASFLPLTVEYRKRMAAAGRVPGGYMRREGRATELDTLATRLVDRAIRPLLPSAWRHETQVIIDPLSYDPDTDIDALAIAAASAALMLSPVPFAGPVAGVRMVREDGEVRALSGGEGAALSSDLDLLVAMTPDGVVMLEGGAAEASEDDVVLALERAREALAPLHEALVRLAAAAGRPKLAAPMKPATDEASGRVLQIAGEALAEALAISDKHARADRISEIEDSALREAGLEHEGGRDAFEAAKKRVVREQVLGGRRIGGRGLDEVRPIQARTGWLPRCHGSAVFTRGETQAVVTCTLGTERDAQSIETLDGQLTQRFLLHYNFPPYSVGEVRPLRGPGRREIGHGYLARRALLPVLPERSEAPYTIRLESLITESNGSSSMASICGGTLAMLDAGLPMARPVAGIAMGLVSDGERHVVLTDILGDEDHVGDMDFKVAGTERGVTAIQLDNKLGAVPREVMAEALEQARKGRLHILARMAEVLPAPREEVSAYVPRAEVLRIEPNRVRDLIGPGGKTIKSVEALGVKVDVSDDGSVRLYAKDGTAMDKARARIRELTGIPRMGEPHEARVVARKPFGVFVRLYEGVEGLLPEPHHEEGATVVVEVTGVNPQGKLQLRRVEA